MALREKQYKLRRDQHGLLVIEESGRCTQNDVADVESDCTHRYQMVELPHMAGAILKALDGTDPKTVEVNPSTFGTQSYTCVKVDGQCQPFAPRQSGGSFSGSYVLRYRIVYQEVGGVA